MVLALFGVLAHAEWIPHQTDEMHGRTLTLFLIGTYFSIALSLSLLTTLMWVRKVICHIFIRQ